MVIGSMLSSILIGQLVSRTGEWKPFVIGGSISFVLCEPVMLAVENAYGDNIAALFLPIAVAGIIAILAAIFIPNRPLSKKTAIEQIEEELGAEEWALRSPEQGGAPDTSGIAIIYPEQKRRDKSRKTQQSAEPGDI